VSAPLLIRVVAPHFVAGLITGDRVQHAAPILKYMVGWSEQRAADYIASKGWHADIVEGDIAAAA
jgi:hypothetical protein